MLCVADYDVSHTAKGYAMTTKKLIKTKDEKKPVNIRLPAELVEYAQRLGFGNTSAGIVRIMYEHMEKSKSAQAAS